MKKVQDPAGQKSTDPTGSGSSSLVYTIHDFADKIDHNYGLVVQNYVIQDSYYGRWWTTCIKKVYIWLTLPFSFKNRLCWSPVWWSDTWYWPISLHYLLFRRFLFWFWRFFELRFRECFRSYRGKNKGRLTLSIYKM